MDRVGSPTLPVFRVIEPDFVSVSVTLNTYADEFDKAQHRGDLLARIESAGFGSI
jgi:hypothetical protein